MRMAFTTRFTAETVHKRSRSRNSSARSAAAPNEAHGKRHNYFSFDINASVCSERDAVGAHQRRPVCQPCAAPRPRDHMQQSRAPKAAHWHRQACASLQGALLWPTWLHQFCIFFFPLQLPQLRRPPLRLQLQLFSLHSLLLPIWPPAAPRCGLATCLLLQQPFGAAVRPASRVAGTASAVATRCARLRASPRPLAGWLLLFFPSTNRKFCPLDTTVTWSINGLTVGVTRSHTFVFLFFILSFFLLLHSYLDI